MSNEQNIDDILKLLKSSVAEDSSTGTVAEESGEDMNDEALKNRLKMQYLETDDDSDGGFDFFDSSEDEKDGYNSYSIDNDFLEEASLEEDIEDEAVETEDMPESAEEDNFVFFEPTVASAEDVGDEVVEDDDIAPWETLEEISEVDNESETYDEASLFEIPDELIADAPIDNELIDEAEDDEDDTTFEDIELRAEEGTLDGIEDYEVFEEPATFTLYDSDSVISDLGNGSSNDMQDGEISDNSFNDIVIDSTETGKALEFDVYAPIDTEKSDAPVDLYTLFREEKEKAAAKQETAIETDEPCDTVEDIKSNEEQFISDEAAPDFSEMNIMMQLGFEEELKNAVGEEKVEDFVRYDVADKEKQRIESSKRKIEARSEKSDYISPEQNETINENYKAESSKSLIKLIGVALIMLVIGIIELMPIVSVRFGGVFDYQEHPAIYMLIGSQFLVLATAVVYKSMIEGLIYSVTSKPTRHSAVALGVAITMLYDLVMILIVAISGEDYPPMFNGLAAMLLFVSAGIDYAMIICERKTFNVYSLNESKYTLVDEAESGRIKEKLVRGGVESSKNIYTPESIDFPFGFKQLCKAEPEWKLVKIFIIPTVILSVLTLIVNMSLGREFAEVAGTLVMTFCLSIPVVSVLAETLPCIIASLRLAKRGSAVGGLESYRKYAECDMVVFDDSYLFEKCKADDLGIAIYDTSIGYLALGCFKALYDKIGGPLSELNIDLPDVFRFDDVKIRRISKNGIDAIVDGRHSLLAGDYEFMQRYGLSFPKSDSDKIKGVGILCLSLNQKVTAKISVKYNTSELFEMLAQRLSDDGIMPIITTCDPLINSSLIAKNRKLGDAPIGVVHKNTQDIEVGKTSKNRYAPDGIISCFSNLKLAEALVWCKRVEKIRHLCETVVTIFSAGGMLLSLLATFLGITQYVNQAVISLFILIEIGAVLALTLSHIPDKSYFTVKALREEIRGKQEEMSEKAAATDSGENDNTEENKKTKSSFR